MTPSQPEVLREEGLLSVSDAARLMGVSDRWVRELMNRGEIGWVTRGRPKRNGKGNRYVLLNSLAADVQERHTRPRGALARARDKDITNSPPILPVEPAEPSAPAHIPITPDGVPDIGALRAQGRDAHADEWDRRMRALARLDVELKKVDYGRIQEAWGRVAAEFNVSTRTLRRWRSEREVAGPAALVPAHGSHRGESRVIPDELGRRIREAWLQDSRWSVEQIYEWIVQPYYHEELGSDYLPHIATVRRYLRRKVLPLAEAYFRQGAKFWRAYVQPKITRELPGVNEIWCADHRLLDVMVLDGGKPRRPWVTAIIDVGSAAWIGWRLCRQPNADTVCHALRQAVLTCGVPRAFLRDRGKEFTAARVGGRPVRLDRPNAGEIGNARRWPAAMSRAVEMSSIWQTLGVQLITAQPYSAWSKPIEPIFGAVSRRYENLLPGWTGRDAKEKPEKLAGEVQCGRLLTWDQIEAVFANLILDWNTKHICGDRCAPPLSYYEGYRGRKPHPLTLSFLLQDRRRLRVRTYGVEVNGQRYMSEELMLYAGATVTVASDPAAPEWVTIYAPDDRVLAVQATPRATWGEFGEPNKLAKRASRAQRAYLMDLRAEIRGATPIEQLDPTGACHLVAERLQREAELTRQATRLELPEADAAALEQQLAVEEAARTAGRKRQPESLYQRIHREHEKRRRRASAG